MYSAYGGQLKEMGKEIHHIPPTDSTAIPRWHGMAILMDKADHAQLLSTGRGEEGAGDDHRDDMWDMIADGREEEATEYEISDIQDKFGGKYDEAIRQMLTRGDRPPRR